MAGISSPTLMRVAVLRALSPVDAALVSWTGARFPTLADASVLRGLVMSLGLDLNQLLTNISQPTALELSDGNWEPVMALLGHNTAFGSVHELTAAFDLNVAPSAAAPSTRAKDWAGWRAVLAWGTARGCLDRLLPMTLPTLKAVIWDLLSCQCTTPVIKGVIDGIQARHRQFGLQSPLVGVLSYSRLIQSLSRFQGTQRTLKLPISAGLVRQVLEVLCTTPAEERDCLALGTATVAGIRPLEGSRLQACDVLFNFDAQKHPAYTGTAALNVMNRKQDQIRRGHNPRIGRASRGKLDIVRRLQVFMASIGTTPGQGCTKKERPHARCPVCAPLFPLFLPDGSARKTAPSPSAFSGMVLKGLKLAGADTRGFSGVCARRGCITTAIEAGVPEAVLWLQSGHGSDRSSRTYINLHDPALLFQTWAAFRL